MATGYSTLPLTYLFCLAGFLINWVFGSWESILIKLFVHLFNCSHCLICLKITLKAFDYG